MTDEVPPTAIEIPGDTLIPDDVFCRDVLGGSHRRTAKRYEQEGLPYLMIRGRKYRPLNAGRAWLAARIVAHNTHAHTRRRTSRK